MALPNPVQTPWTAQAGGGTDTLLGITGPATTAGNLILVPAGYAASSGNTGVVSTVTDNVGNTYIRIDATVNNGTVHLDGELWYCANSIGGVMAVTVEYTQAVLGAIGYVIELPITDVSPLDKHAVAIGTTTSANSGNTATLSQASELVFGWAFVSETTGLMTPTVTTPTSNFTYAGRAGVRYLMWSDALVSSTSAVNSAYSFSGANPQWICGVATFKATAPHASVSRLPLLGCG